jgi:predicted ATP-dependent serine protease
MKDMVAKRAKRLATGDRGAVVLPTGIPAFDRERGGLPCGYPVIVAAAPGVGKSTFLTIMSTDVARSGKQALIVSLEDPPWLTADRVISRILKAPISRTDSPGVVQDPARFNRDWPAWLDNLHYTDEPTLPGITRILEEGTDRGPYSLLVIDYADRVEVPGATGEKAEIIQAREIMKALKPIQRPDLCCVLAAQVNREGRKDPSVAPRAVHIAGSDIYTRHAKMIIILHPVADDELLIRVAKANAYPPGDLTCNTDMARTSIGET